MTQAFVVLLLVAVSSGSLQAGAAEGAGRSFQWTTSRPEAKLKLRELQNRIESFQFGSESIALAEEIVAIDPHFAMAEYYASAVLPPPGNQAHLDRAVLLSKDASDGERRFIEAMVVARAQQGAHAGDAVPLLEKLAGDYPGERLVQVILGQLYQAQNDPAKASAAFRRADAIGPPSSRVRAFLANEDLIAGDYAKARRTFLEIEASLPRGAAPFAVRYGLAFSYLYEGQVDRAIEALQTFVGEYSASGAAQTFPEVFIWNSIARINLENGRSQAALAAYEKGYESVPRSALPDDQKRLWHGRLQHGRCRVLAKMGRHPEAWAEAQQIRKAIDEAGDAGRQYLPAWHYLVGYLKLESGDFAGAVEALKQANEDDPFHRLLLARAYEKSGAREEARRAYQAVVDSKQNGLERALAYPEARRKLSS